MNLIRAGLETALKSPEALAVGLKYTQPQDTLRYWRKADNTKGIPSVRAMGRADAGGCAVAVIAFGDTGCRGAGADADRGPVAVR